jgi:hypothetical protein
MPTACINKESINKVRRNPVKYLSPDLAAHLDLDNFFDMVELNHLDFLHIPP